MKWSDVTKPLILKPFTETTPVHWVYKTKKIKEYGNTCFHCGGKYQKAMHCIPTPTIDKTEVDIYCRLCFLIEHCSFNNLHEFILCWSSLSQLDIIQKTIDYIDNHNKIPDILTIDPNAQKLPISLSEFLNILTVWDRAVLPKNIDNYKIFITPYYDISYLYNYDKSLFIDDEKKQGRRKRDYSESDIHLVPYKPSSDEKLVYDICFRKNLDIVSMKYMIMMAIKVYQHDQQHYENVNKEYHRCIL